MLTEPQTNYNATSRHFPTKPRRWLPVLVVLEGNHDISFLKRISTILHAADTSIPDLTKLEANSSILFVPIGGGGASDIAAWGKRLNVLGQPRFHLHDCETWPETGRRLTAVAQVDRYPNCIARLTTKRSLENYLHPQAILRAGGPQVSFLANDDVATEVARAKFALKAPEFPWNRLTGRTRQRLIARCKRWLNTDAVSQMTPEMLAESDPAGELIGWLRELDELVNW